MRNRQRTAITFAATAILALCMAGAAGCIRQTETPIVAEKQSPEETLPEAFAGSSESQENFGLDTWKQVNAPDRYQVSIAEEHVRLEADAPIEIPSVTQVPTMEIEHAPYTEADCTAALAALKEETGIAEWISNESAPTIHGRELQPNSWVGFSDEENPGKTEILMVEDPGYTKSYTSSDGKYNFSFGQGSNANYTPIMWLTALSCSDGSTAPNDVTDLSDFSITGTARDALETELKNRAETLLKRLSLSDFYLKTAEWKKINSQENGLWDFTGKYGLRLTYVRSFEGIPTVNRDVGWACAAMAPCQYVEFLYQEDGTLLRMKNINRERVSANLGHEDFLLPFDAIAQIFEQYIKYYQTIYSFTDWSLYSGIAVSPTASPDQKPNLSVTVTKVRFGYQLTYDGWDSETLSKGAGKGRLVPVWAFYGTPKAGYWQGSDDDSASMLIPQATENGLLLTVNAVDGTVYGKE